MGGRREEERKGGGAAEWGELAGDEGVWGGARANTEGEICTNLDGKKKACGGKTEKLNKA